MSDDLVELRGLIPRKVADVLDAVALARRNSNRVANRMDIACEVLGEYAEKKAHEATILVRVLKKNGKTPETDGGGN